MFLSLKVLSLCGFWNDIGKYLVYKVNPISTAEAVLSNGL